MSSYLPSEGWKPERDVRDYSKGGLLDFATNKPDRYLRVVVAARRAGKSWFLDGIEHRLSQEGQKVSRLDLRNSDACSKLLYGEPLEQHVLLDEPGPLLHLNRTEFLEACRALHLKGSLLLVALSVGEFHLLHEASQEKHFSSKDVRWLPKFSDIEATELLVNRATNRSPTPELQACFDQLPSEWKWHPFLLELALQVAAEAPELSQDLPQLFALAIERAGETHHSYAKAVFDKGLSDELRNALRAIRDGREPQKPYGEWLRLCGLAHEVDGHWKIADPVLVAWLPPPFRIHHISDVHVGPKSARVADNKVKTGFKDKVDAGVGNSFSRDSYLLHLDQRLTEGSGPQLVIVSGRLAGNRDSPGIHRRRGVDAAAIEVDGASHASAIAEHRSASALGRRQS